jgi:guanine deaminase
MTPDQEIEQWIEHTIDLAIRSMEAGKGGPFAAIIVHQGKILTEGFNEVTSSVDPTAHAEVQAIRKACQKLGSFQLTDCDLYTSCEPCPMCLGAIYWARPSRVYFAASKRDAAKAGFDDDFIYKEISTRHEERRIPFLHVEHARLFEPFAKWMNKGDRIHY